ncbi:hypothetical protein SEUCBS140593_004980 [Sporothrix eucalyptigena]|uniref:Uncharacterized protein n=1 Tax=Sporothrix eucalyptigena TaxID=1812306 RepID=A0ABP0BSI2_9PEZI
MMHAQPAGDPAVLDTAVASQPSLSLSDAAGLLLLIPCMPLADATVERVLDTIASGPHHYPEVLAGAISTQTWKQLVYRPSTHLALPTNMLHTFALSLDERSFARHYLLLADLGTRFQQQTQQTQLDPESAHLAWAKLEYECLLWQVRLPPHLLDLRDELPATPESLVIHQLSSLVLLSLYSHILDNPELGRSVALRPVPGVLYFMCALARSVFICPRAVLDRWELVVDIRATTARILLRLWHQTRFENCRAILAMWTDIEPQHEALAAQIQREIGTGPWTVDEIDGYSVFWTFRDLRALTLELIVQKEKQELHA